MRYALDMVLGTLCDVSIAFSGGTGVAGEVDYLHFNNNRDMTGLTITNFEYLTLDTANVHVKMSNAQLAQFTYVFGTTGTEITTTDATFDLTGKSTGTVQFHSDNATGTLFRDFLHYTHGNAPRCG